MVSTINKPSKKSVPFVIQLQNIPTSWRLLNYSKYSLRKLHDAGHGNALKPKLLQIVGIYRMLKKAYIQFHSYNYITVKPYIY